jgi:serine/threonine protein kinase
MVEDVFGLLGTTLAGTFHVEEVIAEGGFGVVYRAEHVAFRAPVALKCLKIPGTITASQSEIFVENFREEAEILFHLSAQIPEVVRPLHADAMTLEDGTFVPYIAMEWIEGKPLDSIVIMREDDGLPPLALRKIIRLLAPIAHALHKAHRFQVPGGAIVSVTHCDLKPENILITEPDAPVRAKVLDFGIAKARDMMRLDVGRITDSETSRPFTPSYGAPEQWVPKRYGQSGPWTDVWGLALTLCECLTGRPPIDGDMHAMMGTCLDKTRRPSPRAEGADISEDVESVFIKALAVDPRDRYNDIEEFWSALEEASDVPSSFDRARKRRARPTFDDYQRPSEPTPEPKGDGGGLEFDGLELEGEGDNDDDADDAPPSAPPSAPRSLRGSSVDNDVFADSGPVSFDGELDTASSDGGGEFELAEEHAVSLSEAPRNIDVDVYKSVPPAAVSQPRAATTSGSWSQEEMVRSGTHPALSRSGQNGPVSLRGTGSGPVVVAPSEPPQSLMAQLRTPLIFVAVGLSLTILDMVLAKTMGGTLSLGPVRLRWISAGVAAVGMIMAFWNLLGDKDD